MVKRLTLAGLLLLGACAAPLQPVVPAELQPVAPIERVAEPVVLPPSPPKASREELLAAYIDQVRRHIRSNMQFKPPRSQQNPEALFEIRLKPDMSLAAVNQLGRSGNPAFDKAVKRAIIKAGAYPPLPEGIDFALFATHKIKYRLHDLL
ncbi:energy transducer TonB [Chitinimonas sp.]|uniref:energy transducer TonB n=1 Tax=Chitinimonas sp. TaxID=1934313 RepID=UPI0035B0EE97